MGKLKSYSFPIGKVKYSINLLYIISMIKLSILIYYINNQTKLNYYANDFSFMYNTVYQPFLNHYIYDYPV